MGTVMEAMETGTDMVMGMDMAGEAMAGVIILKKRKEYYPPSKIFLKSRIFVFPLF